MAIATDAPTPLSLPASLRPQDWGRYFDAVFLSCWLAMWAIGEVLVGALTVGTIVSLIAASLGMPLPGFFPIPMKSAIRSRCYGTLLKKYCLSRKTVLNIVGVVKLGVGKKTGMGIGEALGLNPREDLDLDHGVIYVQRSVWRGHEQTPKTENAVRQIDIDPALAKALRDYIGDSNRSLLFESRNGTPLSDAATLTLVVAESVPRTGERFR